MQQVSKQLIKGLPRRIALMLLDCGLIVLCYWLAVMLRFDSGDAYRRVEILRAMAPMLLYVLPIYMIVFWFGGLYEIMWDDIISSHADIGKMMNGTTDNFNCRRFNGINHPSYLHIHEIQP